MNPYLAQANDRPYLGGKAKKARVEIVPLIDVMFLLVAFFMVVSISMVRQKGIFVDLSPAHTADSSTTEDNSVTVSINEAGALYLDKERVTPERLQELLSLPAAQSLDTPVIINVDRAARHEHLIETLDILRAVQLHNIIFSVEPKE